MEMERIFQEENDGKRSKARAGRSWLTRGPDRAEARVALNYATPPELSAVGPFKNTITQEG